ncbi:MoaF C-terminal domain-containing protein [Leucobacter sp. wl10]|uniref:MoaF C-terminal domain-containing protein n=1 Tax=Leucobacter sp. wl10 TaxID=2304677 RepID=UPI0013C3382E|nr:MoaF C-terminal domain-containing protein [Leucobacter sp. wl10]
MNPTDSPREVSGLLEHRLPQSSALTGRAYAVTLPDGELALDFGEHTVAWRLPDGTGGTDPYDAVEAAVDCFFVDIWCRSSDARRSLTLVLQRATGRTLLVETVADTSRHDVPVAFEHRFALGMLRGVEAAGVEQPGPTAELLGRRLLSVYSADLVFEQIYLNSSSVAWQCIRGWEPGANDTDEATYWRFAENLYVFGFREEAALSSSVFLLDLANNRSTGKYLGLDEHGALANGALGAVLLPLEASTYPRGMEPR